MKLIKNMELGELAAFVCEYLKKNDIDCVLTGGACVSIYSINSYQSFDLDFVERGYYKRDKIISVLSEIGFTEENRYFKNPDTDFFVEFPPGPLAVGREPVKEIVVKSFSTGMLTLISPTDSVKDRLAAYYHWNDNQCLEQALLIAKHNKIHVKEIKRWSISEGKKNEFKKIEQQMLALQTKK